MIYQKTLTVIVAVILLVFISITSSKSQMKEYEIPHYRKGCESFMKGIHNQILHIDGALATEYLSEIVWFIMLNPNSFYKEFSTDSVAYKRALQGIEHHVFHNLNDTNTVPYERLRLVAIDRLTDLTYSVDSIYLDKHEEMIELLKRVRPTYVDQIINR